MPSFGRGSGEVSWGGSTGIELELSNLCVGGLVQCQVLHIE
jgi:hypothetical protein